MTQRIAGNKQHGAWQRHCRCQAKDSFKMANYVHVRVQMPSEDEKQAEADKTARLRSLRLAKEAADQEHTSREVTTPIPISRGPRISHPTRQAS
jgi:hypothetical protein